MMAKILKASDLRAMTRGELINYLQQLRAELFREKMKNEALKIHGAAGEGGNPMSIRQLRKGIARVLTVYRERFGGEQS